MKSSVFPPSNLATSYGRHRCSKSYPSILFGKPNLLSLSTARRKGQCRHVTTVVYRNSIRDNEASGSARALLDSLFVHAQNLDEKMIGNAQVAYDIDRGINLGTLESELRAALEVLKQKEVDLHEAEMTVMLERAELSCVKEEVEVRAKEIAFVSTKQEKLENELRQSNLKQISQAKEIEDLESQVKEREQYIASMQYVLSSKEEQLHVIKNELMQKNEELAKFEIELQVKTRLLNDTEEIVKRQKTELRELQDSLKNKERDIGIALTHRTLEEEKAKSMEAMLSTQMVAWLLAQEELRKLGEEASRHMEKRNSTMEDFKRVKDLLVAMRTELICSQKSLTSSRQKIEEQEVLLEDQLTELEEQKKSIMAHMMSLKDADTEVDNERSKLTAAEARNKELEQSLFMERDLVHNLQEELEKVKSSARQEVEEVSFLRKELEKKTAEFEERSSLLHLKELELEEARLEIQHLKMELSSLEHALEDRDSELYVARKRLEEVNTEIAELRTLLKNKEDQLIQVTSLLKEKDDYAHEMQGELNATKLKYSEAAQVVERMVNLSNKLVTSAQEEHSTSLGLNAKEKPIDYHQWQVKYLETELESASDGLIMKEMEVVATQKSLNIKDEELKAAAIKLDEKGAEVKPAKEELPDDADDLKTMYSLVLDGIKGTDVVDSTNEAAELEATTTALHKLEEMSRELLGKPCLTTENGGLMVFSSEVARLSKLTEQLVIEAGIY